MSIGEIVLIVLLISLPVLLIAFFVSLWVESRRYKAFRESQETPKKMETRDDIAQFEYERFQKVSLDVNREAWRTIQEMVTAAREATENSFKE